MVTLQDMGGVILLAGLMPLILGLLTAIYWRTRKVFPGFGMWVFADFCLGAGFVLVGLRENLSDLLSIVVGNVLCVYSVVLVYEGAERFFGRMRFDLTNHLILALYIAAESLFTFTYPSSGARIVLVTMTLTVLFLRVAYAMGAHAPFSLRRMCRTLCALFIVYAAFSFVRGVYALSVPAPVDVLAERTRLAMAFSAICSVTVCNFYFLFLTSARVELDLEDTGHRLGVAADTSRREAGQLALLEETGQLVSRSLDEAAILQETVDALVGCFGYAEAAISLLVEDGKLEVKAISGTEDLGYQRGYKQALGDGIIGHVGETGRVHVADDVELDPYYITNGKRSGSAAGIPMLNEGQLLGVLYVESTMRGAFHKSDLQTLRALLSHVVTALNKARLHASTQEHLVVMTALHRISQIITSSLELDRIFPTVLQLLTDTFGYTHISIYLLEQDVLRLGAEVGYPDGTMITAIPVTDGIVGRSVQTGQTQFVRDVSKDPAFLRAARDVSSEICVPLFKGGNVLGVINVEGSRRNPLLERDVDVLSALAGPIAIAIDNAQLHAEAKALARIDGLTGLMNRRTFDETLEAELARAKRYEYPLTLIILDIDDFKAINDEYGHPAGDVLLRATSRLISGNVRSSDSAARYGGDEFAVILPNTSMADGLELAERLRMAAEALPRTTDDQSIPDGKYTISLGLASFPGSGLSADELLLAADHAELNAKKLGKNRVCAAGVHA